MPSHITIPRINHVNAVGDIFSGHDVVASPFWIRSNIDMKPVGIGGFDQGCLAGLPSAGEDGPAFSRFDLPSNFHG
jgi:hypothetical protein